MGARKESGEGDGVYRFYGGDEANVPGEGGGERRRGEQGGGDDGEGKEVRGGEREIVGADARSSAE